ncbi:MAG: RHS repeat-associated core domain-containing protein, partial [Acidobacteriaceae bacterium]
NSEGRPVTIDTVTLTYDALNRMVEQGTSSSYQQIVYDPLGEKFALMNGQNLTKAFAPLPDGGIAAYTSSGLAYYRHPDWLGSSRLASTPARGLYADTAYAPFGEQYAQSGTADPSFTGQNQDTASNLFDFLYREQSPIQGRWISPDPAGAAAVDPTNPQSWNRYGYVRNSALFLVDPLGLCEDPGVTICVTTNLPYPTDPSGGGNSGNGNNGFAGGGNPSGGHVFSPNLPPVGTLRGGGGTGNGLPKCSSLGPLGWLAAGLSSASQLTGTGYVLGIQGSLLAATGVGAEGAGSKALVSDPAGNVGVATTVSITPSVGVRSASFGFIIGGSTFGSLSGYSSTSNVFLTFTGGGSGMNVGFTGTSNSSGIATTAFVGVGGAGLSAGTQGLSNTISVQPLCRQ